MKEKLHDTIRKALFLTVRTQQSTPFFCAVWAMNDSVSNLTARIRRS
jgi:hypothetical protein